MFIKDLLKRLKGEYSTNMLIKRGLSVGKNFLRMSGVFIDPSHCHLISIGDNVTISTNVHILAHDASTKMPLGYTRIGRVDIGNNVFIGDSTIILPNTSIGDNVIIGAGSLVTKSIPENSVAAGNPAKIICSYADYINKMQTKLEASKVYDESYLYKNNPSKEKLKIMHDELDDIGFIV